MALAIKPEFWSHVKFDPKSGLITSDISSYFATSQGLEALREIDEILGVSPSAVRPQDPSVEKPAAARTSEVQEDTGGAPVQESIRR
jgi:hypothetical protein